MVDRALTYSDYLALDDILAAQRPRSDEHDEMLFIVIHQVYELWFKQLLHEIRRVGEHLGAGNGPGALHVLKRVLTILKVAVAQVDVLETMTPRQFTGFRSRLDAASGFQSAQFRTLEALLGRRGPNMSAHYPEASPERAAIDAATREPSVYDWFAAYLAAQGFPVPDRVRHRDVSRPVEPDDAMQRVLVDVYAADGVEAQLAERLVDLDEGLQEWRYRHVKMVERTIGDRSGTGGSSGARYLRNTLFTPLFPDLWQVRSRL